MYLITVALLVCVSLSFPYERTKYIMGIPVTVKTDRREVPAKIFSVFKKVDFYFSNYRKDSILCRLNRQKILKIDNFFRQMLEKSLTIYKDTYGYTDISIGNLTVRNGHAVDRCPAEKSDTTGIQNITIKGSVVVLKNGISLDFGAVGKGFAVDRAVEEIRGETEKTVINASGEIRCIGKCSVFIKNPFGNGAVAHFKTVKQETGISTSGTYERGNHLFNPFRKEFSASFISITLFSDIENVYLDGYATAVSVMPEEMAVEFLNRKKIGFVLIKKERCYIKGRYNDRFITELTFLINLPECKKRR